MNYISNGLPPPGQDSGSGTAMQALMWYLGQQQPQGSTSQLPPAGTGGNLSEYASGYNPALGATDAAVAAAPTYGQGGWMTYRPYTAPAPATSNY